MSYLIKNYKKICEEEFSAYGFKRNGVVFIRVVNDVVQYWTIEKICAGRECRVSFAVYPICMPLDDKYDFVFGFESFELRRFEASLLPFLNDPLDGWDIDPKSNESMDACVSDIVRYIKEYLIPFFDRTNNCGAIAQSYIDLVELFKKNRLKALAAIGIADGKADLAMPLNFDPILLMRTTYYAALKSGDYSLALKCRKEIEREKVEACERRGFMKQHDIDALAKFREEMAHLEAGDYDYFDKIIAENEESTGKLLKSMLK